MKKKKLKQREIDVKRSLAARSHKGALSKRVLGQFSIDWRYVNRWIDKIGINSLNIDIDERNHITIHLPKVMNFSDQYEDTVLYFTAIRNLVNVQSAPRKAYKLRSVNFDNLVEISTSAALVLTAELSKWEDSIRKRLTPNIANWNPEILSQLKALGFFDVFESPQSEIQQDYNTNLNFVRYIKGKCTEKSKTSSLRSSIQNVVGDEIKKWTFLDSGLSEAITNVSHHAYPESLNVARRDRNWYLTGSFNECSQTLKIAFYDQGIGIPRSLPSSEIWEKVKRAMAKLTNEERQLHKTLLKAAVKLNRTSTDEGDRGKGLNDMLTFIKMRKQGYISILSLKGLYKYTMLDGVESEKSVSFRNELRGTLIIWSVTL